MHTYICFQDFLPKKGHFSRLCIACLCCLLLAGCGASWRISDLWNSKKQEPDEPVYAEEEIGNTHGSARLPEKPHIPDELRAGTVHTPDSTGSGAPAAKNGTAANAAEPSADTAAPIRYKTVFVCTERPDLAKKLKELSVLEQLIGTPPDDYMGLDYRIQQDEAMGISVLRAEGFYDGTAERTVDTDSRPVKVTLTLKPGRQYVFGRTEIRYAAESRDGKLPRTLEDVGLKKGNAAVAGDILDAIDAIPPLLHTRGYPLAHNVKSDFAVIPEKAELIAVTETDQGPLARMNNVRAEGSDSVDLRYFQRMRNWRKGQIWNEKIVDAYRDILNQQGIFRSVEVSAVPAETEEVEDDGLYSNERGEPEKGNRHPDAKPYDILVSVKDGPQKSVGGGLNYDSERGVGAQAFWEHRNLFGQAEILRAKAEIWQDTQNLSLHFDKPAFLSRMTALVSDAWLRKENIDAYDQEAGYADIGLRHRFGRYLWGTVKVSVEGGSLDDHEHDNTYQMIGLPLQLTFDTTGSLLNATKGVRATVTGGPYSGEYGESEFSLFPTQLELQAFQPLVGEDRLVLALRAKGGTLWRDDAGSVPASVRYYSGGGGSVRGYDYYSLGPKNSKGDPLGGASFAELSAELRWKLTDTFGIVPFFEGGTVSNDITPDPNEDEMLWSAGLGFRYYTSIGPMRVDFAMPLNPRESDSLGPAVYISIGQAF